MIQIEVLYEDDYILVVNKPNNVLVHHSHYARNIKGDSLVQLIQKQKGLTAHPIHRLDYKTSGVLMFSKKKEYVSPFQSLFDANEIIKKYLAIVRGFTQPEGSISSPVKNPETKVYKDALTEYVSLNNTTVEVPVHPYSNSRYSLIQLTPITGRMHQLRIHLNKISHPIVGDYKYGDRFHNRMFEQRWNCHYLLLHARTLQFMHPFTKETLSIQANIPKHWDVIMEDFSWQV